ncbi:MAG: hypothetical protein EKK64_08700 [Neisseriaceae bacterium]|nr:MAG: hypothetical protein EKK64_08700 [Neisseriaceae bacterium]
MKKNRINFDIGIPKTVTEVLIDNKRVPYGLMNDGFLSPEYLKERFPQLNLEYIGSSSIYYVNGIEQKSSKTYHFWKKV